MNIIYLTFNFIDVGIGKIFLKLSHEIFSRIFRTARSHKTHGTNIFVLDVKYVYIHHTVLMYLSYLTVKCVKNTRAHICIVVIHVRQYSWVFWIWHRIKGYHGNFRRNIYTIWKWSKHTSNETLDERRQNISYLLLWWKIS